MKLGFIALLSLHFLVGRCADLPCNRRDVGIEGRSVVCVCDANYCDTITREAPGPRSYVAYTSSNDGLRFHKSYGVIERDPLPPTEETENSFDDEETIEDHIGDDEEEDEEYETSVWENVVFRLSLSRRFQFIEGFGGSVTDAAAINWRKLSDGAQTNFINSYFSKDGLEYNMIRVPIGGADFSTHPYTYNEYPWHDAALTNFSLTSEDFFYKLPMIRRSQHVATDEIKITASTWSPPVWMKTNERITGFGQVRPEYYQSYADYHLKFIEEYSKANVNIWAITTSNEPLNGLIPVVTFNSIGWTPAQLGRWVADNLGPTIRNSRFNDTLILAVDDQRYIVPIWLAGMEREAPESIDYIDGVAIHYYGNFVPPSVLTAVQRRYPGKILLSTEACEGPMPWHAERVEIGSWRRARRYVTSILQDLNNYVVGWIDWNLCLDPEGGPNWANNFVDAPILVYGENDEFIKQPMFYAMGHFSKFIPRGSYRVRVRRRSLFTMENLAVVTPEGNIVLVLQNITRRPMNVKVYLNSRDYVAVVMEPQSIKTVEINRRLQ